MKQRFAAALAVVLLVATALGVPAAQGAEPAKSTTQRIGDIGEYALPAVALATTLAHRDGRGIGQLALVGVTTLAITHGLKETIDAERPNGGGRSFPSAHTASAFFAAGFLHRRYGWRYGVPAYAAATFVGYSRVHAKQHWTRDVIAGGAIGLGANLVFTRRHRGASLVPTSNGLMLRVEW